MAEQQVNEDIALSDLDMLGSELQIRMNSEGYTPEQELTFATGEAFDLLKSYQANRLTPEQLVDGLSLVAEFATKKLGKGDSVALANNLLNIAYQVVAPK